MTETIIAGKSNTHCYIENEEWALSDYNNPNNHISIIISDEIKQEHAKKKIFKGIRYIQVSCENEIVMYKTSKPAYVEYYDHKDGTYTIRIVNGDEITRTQTYLSHTFIDYRYL